MALLIGALGALALVTRTGEGFFTVKGYFISELLDIGREIDR